MSPWHSFLQSLKLQGRTQEVCRRRRPPPPAADLAHPARVHEPRTCSRASPSRQRVAHRGWDRCRPSPPRSPRPVGQDCSSSSLLARLRCHPPAGTRAGRASLTKASTPSAPHPLRPSSSRWPLRPIGGQVMAMAELPTRLHKVEGQPSEGLVEELLSLGRPRPPERTGFPRQPSAQPNTHPPHTTVTQPNRPSRPLLLILSTLTSPSTRPAPRTAPGLSRCRIPLRRRSLLPPRPNGRRPRSRDPLAACSPLLPRRRR